MNNIVPFKIDVAPSVLDDLKERLQKTRWTDEPENAGWDYGTNPAYLKELTAYWQDTYDWRKQEAMLNAFPQFKADIEGIGIHFIYVRSKHPHAQPLLLTHEWPDSSYRFYKVIPLLTDQAFDVIIPSLPGHGFSDRISMSSAGTAHLWAKLMTDVLGYDTYLAAGDYAVTTALASLHPDRVKGIHLTDTGYPNGTEDWSQLSSAEQTFGQHIQHWFFAEGAFNMIQSTKPQTLGYALNDSPVGLASWILEKFHSWSDTGVSIENSFSKDELLTNIMIYWVTQTINTSIRRYLVDARAIYAQGAPQPVKQGTVPASVTIYPADSDTPKEWAERRVNLKRYTRMSRGGRFAALEVPELYTNDLIDSVKLLSN